MSYLAPVITVGGEGGLPFSFIGAETGALLKKLDVWVGPNQVRCITLQMSDGAQKTYGTVKKSGDKMVSFTFENGDYFSSLTLWPNNAGDHLGAIKFETTKGRISKACMTSGEPTRSPTPVDVGSGMCFGVQGRSGSEIDALGFMFIKVSYLYSPLVAKLRISVISLKNHNSPQEWIRNVLVFLNILIIFTLHDWARLNHLAGRIRPAGRIFDTSDLEEKNTDKR
uniref:Jacalin-type lectin domain-containing protein n=1 Tax=Oryzias latipes TaxID=8090 RepID=H2N0H9_ORYLA